MKSPSRVAAARAATRDLKEAKSLHRAMANRGVSVMVFVDIPGEAQTREGADAFATAFIDKFFRKVWTFEANSFRTVPVSSPKSTAMRNKAVATRAFVDVFQTSCTWPVDSSLSRKGSTSSARRRNAPSTNAG